MGKPKLLDLFCGAGGCSVGYARAGFDVTGVDIKPQPRYPYEFFCGDVFGAWPFSLDDFDVIHASPPCQHYTAMLVNRPLLRLEHPDLLGSMRQRLLKYGGLWVIENVPGAPVEHGVMLCGSMFNLKVRRHRFFETSHLIFTPAPCKHDYRAIQVVGHAGNKQNFTMETGMVAMGINWMIKSEMVQAIPPAYTEYIGQQLINFV